MPVKAYDILLFGLNSLTHRKLRSWLTVVGIVIGVASVVALISIGQGAQAQINSQLSGLGADIMTITPGHERASGGMGGFGGGFGGFGGSRTSGNLTEDDVRIVRSTQGVLYVNGIVSERTDIAYLTETSSVSVQGVDASVWRYFIESIGLQAGIYLNVGDGNSVVISNRIANGMFTQNITVNRQITIDDKTFVVVGILNSASTFGQQDSVIYMTKEVARQTLGLDSKRVSSISVKVADSSQVQTIATDIESKLQIMHHVQAGKQDFTVTTAQSVQNQVNSMMGTMTLLLAAIAGISLLVGAIGISNTMFTSVMERTRQIGILKALGATNGEVTKIFLTEAGLIGLLGGVLGVLLGMTASGLLSEMGVRLGMQGGFGAVVSPELVIFSISFSIAIGAVSGFFPARRAAGLQPVEALRYE